jgi:hypothetical protein
LEFNSLWKHEPRALMAYTRPADERYSEAFRTLQEGAARRGWFVPRYTIIQTTKTFDLWYVRWFRTHGMSVHVRGRELLIDDKYLSLMSDDDVTCAVSHEIGHIVDATYGREKDLTLWQYRNEECEKFADAVGALLCGRERYAAFFRRHIEYRMPGPTMCGPSDPVTQ